MQSVTYALPAVAGIVALFLCASVFFGARSHTRLSFSYFTISMSIWSILISVFLISPSLSVAQVVVPAYYVAAAALIHGFVLFSWELINGVRMKRWSWMWMGLLFPFIVTSIVSIWPNLMLTVGLPHDSVFHVQLSPWYAVFVVYFLSYLFAATVLLISGLNHGSREQMQQVKSLLGIAAIVIPFGAMFNLILPSFGNYSLIMIGPVFVFCVVLVIFYSVIRHKLFDLKLAVVRSIAYLFVVLTLAVVYFGLAYIVSATIFPDRTTTGLSLSPINIILALVLAFLFQPVKQFFDRVTDRIFYHDRYDENELIQELGHRLTTTTDTRDMLRRVADLFDSLLRSSHSTFVIYRDNRTPLVTGSQRHARFTADETDAFRIALLQAPDRVIRLDDQSGGQTISSRLKRMLLRRHEALMVPLKHPGGVVGFLLLGEHKAGGYSDRDVRVLEAIADELVIAIQNARTVEEFRNLNTHLQQRIDAATQDLRVSNEKLQKLDETKDEFISMASHQLRTPLTSVKGYIDMVLEGDAGPITPAQKQLLNQAFESSERMVHLISDFLNVSRLQNGKFTIDARSVDLAHVTAQEVEALQSTAKAHNLKLLYRKPRTLPLLQLDEGKIRQVIMNFIDNAIFYSAQSSSIEVKLFQEDGDVVLEVHDHGIGVPKAEQAHLFGKFFRAANARRQRPDGTGVGLFLARKVIDAHQGHVIFHSVEGKGSVFGFRLPIAKLRKESDDTGNNQSQG